MILMLLCCNEQQCLLCSADVNCKPKIYQVGYSLYIKLGFSILYRFTLLGVHLSSVKFCKQINFSEICFNRTEISYHFVQTPSFRTCSCALWSIASQQHLCHFTLHFMLKNFGILCIKLQFTTPVIFYRTMHCDLYLTCGFQGF